MVTHRAWVAAWSMSTTNKAEPLVPGDRPPRGGHGPCCLSQHGANDVEMLGMTECRKKQKKQKRRATGPKKMIKKKRQKRKCQKRTKRQRIRGIQFGAKGPRKDP